MIETDIGTGLTDVLEGWSNIALPAFQVGPQIDLELQTVEDTDVPIERKGDDLAVGEFFTLAQQSLGLAGMALFTGHGEPLYLPYIPLHVVLAFPIPLEPVPDPKESYQNKRSY